MRIWVARPEPGAGRTAERLRALGHAPIVAPVLAVAPTASPRPAVEVDALLLTSAQGAALSAVAERDLTVFAVGERTADAARAAGFRRVVTSGADAVALARLVRESLPRGARLLHVAGEDRKAEPASSLVAAGYRVTVWEAYAARAVDTLPDPAAAALRGRELAAVLHYSRRSAQTALLLAQSAGLDGAFRGVRHYCLSADVAVPLVEAGIAAHFVAAQPSEDALLAGLTDPAGTLASPVPGVGDSPTRGNGSRRAAASQGAAGGRAEKRDDTPVTSSRDERGKSAGESTAKPGSGTPSPTSATPSQAPAKPGSTGSSTMQPTATPKPAEAPKAAEPVKPGGASAPGVAGPTGTPSPARPATSPTPGGVPGKPPAATAEAAKSVATGGSGAAQNAGPTPAKTDVSASKDGGTKPGTSIGGMGSPGAAGSGQSGVSAAPKSAATELSKSGAVETPKSGAVEAAKSGAAEPAKGGSSDTAKSPGAAAPTSPVKSAATGSSAVPPVPPAPPSGAAKPEAPAKGGTTGSSAIGPGTAKPASGTAGSGPASAGATRVTPGDALTDGPILDLRANRSPDAAATGAAAKDASPAKDGTKDAGAKAAGPAGPAAASAAMSSKSGPGFGVLATSGLIGGVIGAALLFLLAQTGVLAPKGEAARLDALDKRIAALAPSDAVAALDRRVQANETALKPLPEAITRAQAAAKSADERADQALKKATGAPTAPASEGSGPATGTPAVPADLVARLDALDQRVSALQEEPGRDQPADAKAGATQSGDETVRLADLDVRLKALETKGQASGAPAVPEEDLAPKLAALQGKVETSDKALGQRLDQLQQTLDGRITAATESVQQATQASRQAAEAGKAQADETAKAVDRRLQEQADRIAALDKAMDGSAKAATVQATLRAVTANRIADALAAGVPYADALTSLRGSDPGDGARLEPLAPFADTGAPTAAALANEFRPIADKIASARRSAQSAALASTGSFGDRLMGMAASVVQVKRVAPGAAESAAPAGTAASDGGEPEVTVQQALDRGRLAEAAQAFAALPEEARAQAREFGARLKAAADARTAAQSLQAEAFKALSAPTPGR